MDLKVANWIFDTFGSNKIFLKVANVLTHIGDAITIISIIALLLIFKKTRRLGFFSLVIVGISYLCNIVILKAIIARERPFVVCPDFMRAIELAGAKLPSGKSMPSGHSLATMTFAMTVFLFNKKIGIGAIVLSVVCGLTRMILCVHYLTDVLLGFALGIVFAIALYYLLKYLEKIYLKRKEK